MHTAPLSLIEITLILLLASSLAVSAARRFKIPLEVVLTVASAALSFLPMLPHVSLDPNLVFLVFLPPILFGAAYFTSWRDFKANLRPIGLLAIGLVFFHTLAVGFVLHALLPEVPLPVAFLFGAIVAPPDASAATTITRQLGVPRRLLTVIEGESLVNDASALIAYRFGIAAVVNGTFSLWEASWKFVWVSTAGALVGIAIAWAGGQLLRRLEEVHAQTAISLLTAFACFAVADRLGVSGVLAAVAGGLYFGRLIPRIASPELRVDAEAGWRLILFLINGLAFTLIGLQLPRAIAGLSERYWMTELVLVAALIVLTVIVVRFLWVFPATYLPRWLSPALRARDPSPSPRNVTLLAWTGMRGIVSLAAALALPEQLPDGSVFPHRDLLIFLTYWTILATLLLPSLTLPMLMRWLRITPGQENEREEALARAALTRHALEQLRNWRERASHSAELILPTLERYERRLERWEANAQDPTRDPTRAPFSPLFDGDRKHRRFYSDLLRAERQALLELRQRGTMHDEVFHNLSRELDLEELRLRTARA